MISKHSVEVAMDWELLREQKRLLLQLWDSYGDSVEGELIGGVLSLIDHIQDSCFEQGARVAWLEEGDELRSVLEN